MLTRLRNENTKSVEHFLAFDDVVGCRRSTPLVGTHFAQCDLRELHARVWVVGVTRLGRDARPTARRSVVGARGDVGTRVAFDLASSR